MTRTPPTGTAGKPPWRRTTKRSPCVVCGRVGSCVYTGDPKTPDAVLCVNKRSEAICGRGFLHRLDEHGPVWPAWVKTLYVAKRMLETSG